MHLPAYFPLYWASENIDFYEARIAFGLIQFKRTLTWRGYLRLSYSIQTKVWTDLSCQ